MANPYLRRLEVLIDALQDRDEAERAKAADRLGGLGDRRAVEPLVSVLRREAPGSEPQLAAARALERLGAGKRTPARSALTSPLALWAAGVALFSSAVWLSATQGGFVAGAVGVAGFLLLIASRVQAVRRGGERGFFYPGPEAGGGEAVFLGASTGAGWGDFGGGADGDGGGFGGGDG